MAAALSQDELDGLLTGLDGTEGEGGAETTVLTPSQQEAAEYLTGAFKSGCSGVGTMLGAQSSLGAVSTETVTAGAAETNYGAGQVLLTLEMSGALTGSLHLFLPDGGATGILSTSTGADAGSIDFNGEQLDTLKELVGPVLMAVNQSLSKRMGAQIQTSPLQAQHMDGTSFPLQESLYLALRGPLSIQGIMDDDVTLMVSDDTAERIAQGEPGGGATASPAGETAPAPRKKKGVLSSNLSLLMDVHMPLTVELGRTQMYIKEVLAIGEGSILELDKLAGEPVDLMVNGKLIAKGEVVVIDENFGVRVTDIVSPKERLKMTGL